MKDNSELSGGEKFFAAINDVWRFASVALTWLWEHGGPLLLGLLGIVASMISYVWKNFFGRESKSTDGTASSSLAADSSASNNSVNVSTSSTDELGNSGGSAKATPSQVSQAWSRVEPRLQAAKENAAPALSAAWSNAQSTSKNIWESAKPRLANLSESIHRGTASLSAKVDAATAEGGSANETLGRLRGWLRGGLPNVIGFELLVLLVGALFFWLFGTRSLYGYSWFVMVIGVLIALAGMIKGYFDMNLERVEGFFTPNRDGAEQEYAAVATESQLRYTAFAQMAFWCLIGIVAVIFGATVSSILF